MPHPLPPVEYFSSEDAPLLCDYPQLHAHLDTHHGDFEVANFPKTPVLPQVIRTHDDSFPELVSSSTSEVPPAQKAKEVEEEVPVDKPLAELPTLEYILNVTVILFVQLFIPIPSMFPMGLNFARRAVLILLPGFAIGLLGHSAVNLARALPNAGPLGPGSLHHLARHLRTPSLSTPALLAHLKIAVLGGALVGAVLAHVLNLFILGHTVCRLARGLEPDPVATRASMDASRAFQRAKRVLLDLATALSMVPAGLAAQRWGCAVLGFPPPAADIAAWHTVAVALAGVGVLHAITLVHFCLAWRDVSGTRSAGKQGAMAERRKELGVL